MKYIRIVILSCCLCMSANIWAQISTNEKPVSFGIETKGAKESELTIQTVIMPLLDMNKILAEDKEDEEYDIPPRFGYQHKVDYTIKNSGTWQELPNGDKLWRLNVVCPNALSVNFCYDQFWIPEGGKFFVYSKDKKQAIGAFTSENNKGERENVKGFATGLVYSDDVILEYYQPKEVTDEANISIDYVVHGYRYINFGQKGLGDSGSCMVNVNCEEGQNWQNEKKAVALILVNGNRYCTGSLINTTNLSQAPLFLTANHCISNYGDAEGNTNLSYYSFYWNYEAPGCSNTSIEPVHLSTSGATILANNVYSDFALLRLSEDPKNISTYTPFYLGWDHSGQSGAPGICLHHPAGDVKKVSTARTVSSSYWSDQSIDPDSHWEVLWKATLNGHGTTQGGSSGSPLFNSNHKVIGQLHGGTITVCDPNKRSFYGKFNVSWSDNSNIYRQLCCWLDSLNSGVDNIEGLIVVKDATVMDTNEQLYCNICIVNGGQLTIQNNIELMGSSRVIVDGGGILVVDGGKLSNTEIELKPGAILRLINNGIIETRNGFEAPTGTIVDVIYGQIL